MGLGIGTLAGAVHAALSRDLLHELSFVLPRNDAADTTELLALAGRIGMHAVQGAVSGALLGLAGRTGDLPQSSRTKLALILSIQSAVGIALDLVSDYIVLHGAERWARETVRARGGDFAGRVVEGIGGRRGLFVAAGGLNNEENMRNLMLLTTIGGTALSQLITLLEVVPEIVVVRTGRNELAQKKKALEASLIELQKLKRKLDRTSV